MSWKSIVITGLLCVVASPVLAQPVISFADGGLDGGNQVWDVSIAPNPTGFVVDSSLAVELDLTFTSAVLNFDINSAFWNVNGTNPGNNPFTQTMTETVIDGNTLFIGAGSELYADTNAVLLGSITTTGEGGTVTWGGLDTGAGFMSSRIAQQSTNYDGLEGMFEIGGPSCIDGDFDCSGGVENGDLTLLLDNWAKPATPIPAGWTGTAPTDPAIDNDELTLLLDNWANVAGSGSVAAAAVPEPATVALLGLAVAACGLGRRRAA